MLFFFYDSFTSVFIFLLRCVFNDSVISMGSYGFVFHLVLMTSDRRVVIFTMGLGIGGQALAVCSLIFTVLVLR